MVTEHVTRRPSLRRRARLSLRARVALLLGLVCLALAIDAHFIEPARLIAKHETLHLPALPAALAGLRIAFVADLHVGSPHWGVGPLRGLIARVNAEHPDLILLGGDYLTNGVEFGTRVEPTRVAQELGALHAPLGVIAVLGNHDGWSVTSAFGRALTASGIRLLGDQVTRIETRGVSFAVLGLNDEETRRRSASEELALAPPGVPLMVLTHEPDIFAQLDSRALLTLAGHTHGGQVRFPFIGAPIVRSRYGQRYLRGHIVEQGRHLYVTSGVGTSVWPIRFGVPPEYVVLTLRQ